MPDPHGYTVGWICAITTEYVAAQAFLDEKHEGPDYVAENDDNDYVLGRMGKHNVVIAVLPNGEYGISSATGVAKDMLHSFPNVRIGLMVGIGGGAPSPKHDIRLGDIVVSAPSDGTGGVFQYDFGKTVQDQVFRPTGYLNQSPKVLRTAVNGLKAQYECDGHQLNAAIDRAFEQKTRLRKRYGRPDPRTDRLYRTEVVHPPDREASCAAVCSDDPSNLISRSDRTEEDDNPGIHYGLIASANQLMKDALVRDKLAAEKDVLCFEMEAAGLMNHFPCLVIRGICDYSDSHKNKEWQGYAAMMAAAYAKDLLCRIPPNKVEAEKKIGDVLPGLYEAVKEHLDTGKEQLQFHKDLAEEDRQTRRDLAKERLSKKEQECHQLFRLTSGGTNDATYEWYKNRVQDRVEGTCQWLLNHEHFQSWLEQESGPLLVSADPGCGKSVLAKYLIDNHLPRSTTAAICYFFFKDQDQNTVRQALCAILHQLFYQKPALIKHAMPQFRKDGHGLVDSTASLWEVLRSAIKDPKAGPIIIVLDALDECAEGEFANFMLGIESQFHSSQSGLGKIKYLLTCRPYDQIVSKFWCLLKTFPNIRIPGEQESETISQEVNSVITYRVNQLSEQKRLSPQIRSHLENRLKEATHRTYLWVYLIFDFLEKEDFKKTQQGVDKSTIMTLPGTINQAYEQILNKSKDRPIVRKALSIILAALRPLTVSELNIALSIEHTSQSIHDLDLENEEDFKSRLRSWCGLFISIYYGKVYFLHQTAREFLLAEITSPTTSLSGPLWHHSIAIHEAHTVLTEVCVTYLDLFNSEVSPRPGANRGRYHSVDGHAFLDYSAKSWGSHFRLAGIKDDHIILPLTLRICNPESKSYSAWFRVYWNSTDMVFTSNFTDIMVASYFGHEAVVKLLLRNGAEVEDKDTQYSRMPLLWTAMNGHAAVVKLLLDKGIKVDAKDKYSCTPLLLATENGHEEVVKLLLEKGANIELKDTTHRQTPLSWAAEDGHEVIVKLLLEKGIKVDAKDKYSCTPLLLATENGHEAVVKLLLEKGANIETKNITYGRTPLLLAAQNGHVAVIKLLLEKGAKVEAKDVYDQTPLSRAAENGHEAVVKLLLEKGANIETKSIKYGRTPLLLAAENGHEAVIKLLFAKGAKFDGKDWDGWTPLPLVPESRHRAAVKLLRRYCS